MCRIFTILPYIFISYILLSRPRWRLCDEVSLSFCRSVCGITADFILEPGIVIGSISIGAGRCQKACGTPSLPPSLPLPPFPSPPSLPFPSPLP